MKVCIYIIIFLSIWFECNRTVIAQAESQQIISTSQTNENYLDTSLPYKYRGHNCSHKFHKMNCPFGMCISKKHLVIFHFRKDAIEANYKPCRYCLPPVWYSVHGVLLRINKDELTQKELQTKDAINR